MGETRFEKERRLIADRAFLINVQENKLRDIQMYLSMTKPDEIIIQIAYKIAVANNSAEVINCIEKMCPYKMDERVHILWDDILAGKKLKKTTKDLDTLYSLKIGRKEGAPVMVEQEVPGFKVIDNYESTVDMARDIVKNKDKEN